MHPTIAVVALAVLKLGLRLELGPEYDSNANRAEIVKGAAPIDRPTASPLLRTTLRGEMRHRLGRNSLQLIGGLGAKLFFNPDVADQDVLVGQLAVVDRVRLADWLHLGASGDYYDAGQADVTPPCNGCNRHRDFRSLTGLGRVALVDDPGSLTLGVGYRDFAWKPDDNFSFRGVVASGLAVARLRTGVEGSEAEWDLSAGYHLERRSFTGRADVNVCAPGSPLLDVCIVSSQASRRDWFHEGTIELTYVGALLVGASYGLQLNQSNSFGQTLLRHLVGVKLGARLPWSLYLTVKAQLLLTSYFDPVLLDRQQVNPQTFITIEDENRNAFLVDVERPLGGSGLALAVRYSLYTNEISASPVQFLRQVVYLGLSYRVGQR